MSLAAYNGIIHAMARREVSAASYYASILLRFDKLYHEKGNHPAHGFFYCNCPVYRLSPFTDNYRFIKVSPAYDSKGNELIDHVAIFQRPPYLYQSRGIR